MHTQDNVIFWFRQDLRIADNPALTEALKMGSVLPIYIVDTTHPNQHQLGGATQWWLHHSLSSLNHQLKGHLCLYQGDPNTILHTLIQKHHIKGMYWNRCYTPWQIQRDKQLKEHLKQEGLSVKTYNASLLWEPWNILKDDGTPYKVFTPFFKRGCLGAPPPRPPLSVPKSPRWLSCDSSLSLDALKLLPKKRWDTKLENRWTIGEEGASNRLSEFLKEGIADYKEGRNFPAKPYVSRLSPHLRFGEISPHQIWHSTQQLRQTRNVEHFLSELGWREFSYYLLYHFPQLPTENLQQKFDTFPWKDDTQLLSRWHQGLTGYPFVDAGMRELWQTGYMHNRMRMVVGSFLVKNLRLHWHHGERWFWDCLIDADLANNSASWQWVAGCGADAAPYFRIFNPVTQGHKFDPDGTYTKQFIPELERLPNTYLFSPWEAPEDVLKECGIELGTTYPHPIVPLKESREAALDAFQQIRTASH